MNFTHFDLGIRQSGQILAMKLAGNAANVRLMDSSNFQCYINSRRYKFYGGLINKSLYKMQIPSSGHWHVIVDMQGLRGTNRIWIRVLPSVEEIDEEFIEIIGSTKYLNN